MKETYKPIVQKIPWGYTAIIGIYSGKKFITHINFTDAVFDSPVIAHRHALREIENIKKKMKENPSKKYKLKYPPFGFDYYHAKGFPSLDFIRRVAKANKITLQEALRRIRANSKKSNPYKSLKINFYLVDVKAGKFKAGTDTLQNAIRVQKESFPNTVIVKKEHLHLIKWQKPITNYLGLSKRISKRKARMILHHGFVKGHPLTKKQYAFFGARASGTPYKAHKNPAGWELYDAFDTKELAIKYARDLKKTYPKWSVKVKRIPGTSTRLGWGIYVIETYQNPKSERKSFLRKFTEDPYYYQLFRKAAHHLIEDLKKGTFNKRYWIKTLQGVVNKVAKEHGIKLSRLDKIKLAFKLARMVWAKYVRK